MGLTALDGKLFFTVDASTYSADTSTESRAFQVWASDGTASGTVKLADSSSDTSFTEANGSVFFDITNTGGADTQVWTSDGTAGGTHESADLGNAGDATDFAVVSPSPLNGTGGVTLSAIEGAS